MKHRKSGTFFLPTVSIILILSLLLSPTKSIEAAKIGLLLWFNTILPSLLPFIIGANLLMASNSIHFFEKLFKPIMESLFNLPGSCAFPWIMGLISGYPMGAKITAELKENNHISHIEAQRLLSFSNNSGPFFIIGAVGVGMFQNEQLGYFLLVIHFISSVLTGILFRFYGKNKSIVPPFPSRPVQGSKAIGEALGTSITKSMEVIIQIGGYIILFSVIGSLLKNTYLVNFLAKTVCLLFRPFGITMELAFSWIMGVIEMSNGVYMVSTTQASQWLQLPIISFIIAWGGFSVHSQSLHLLQTANIKSSIYFLGKLLHGMIAFLLTLFTSPLYRNYAEKSVATLSQSYHYHFSILGLIFNLFIFFLLVRIVCFNKKTF